MALSIIGTPICVTGTSVTLPTHAIGDIIIIFAYRDGNNTVPTKPAASGNTPAWVDINAPAGLNTTSARSAYFVATSATHTSGTWTGATGMAAIVYRGQAAAPIGGAVQSSNVGSGNVVIPAVTLSKTDGSSAIIGFAAHRSVTAWSAAPTGYTRRAAVNTEVCINTKNDTTSDGGYLQPCTSGNSGYVGEQIEIIAKNDPPTVALNTPLDAATGVSTTPTFNFTGTDVDANAVGYNLQVHTSATFPSPGITHVNSASLAGATVASLSFSKSIAAGDNRLLVVPVQVFDDTSTAERTVTSVTYGGVALTKLLRQEVGSIGAELWYLIAPAVGTANVVVTLGATNPFAIAGADNYVGVDQTTPFEAQNSASGFGLSATLNVTTLTAGAVVVDSLLKYNTLEAVTVGAGQTQTFNLSSGAGFGIIGAGSYETKAAAGSVTMSWSWTTTSRDWVIVTGALKPAAAANPLLNKISGTDTGFTAGHPYSSGVAKEFTVQSGDTLANGTYYWRVRAIDPSGSNTYGAWSATRSFTVSGAAIPTTLTWKNHIWDKRLTTQTYGPGFGAWSEVNATIDGNGYLNLKITNPSGTAPIGSEVITQQQGFGYGIYTTTIGSSLTGLDKNVVFGGMFPLFYGNPYIEFDVNESSKWDGGYVNTQIAHNSYYGTDPDFPTGQFDTMDIPADAVQTHRLIWTPGQAKYDSFIGSDTSGTPFFTTVHNANIPVPSTERVVFNLWCFASGGTAGADDIDIPETTVIIRDFSFVPMSTNKSRFFHFI